MSFLAQVKLPHPVVGGDWEIQNNWSELEAKATCGEVFFLNIAPLFKFTGCLDHSQAIIAAQMAVVQRQLQ